MRTTYLSTSERVSERPSPNVAAQTYDSLCHLLLSTAHRQRAHRLTSPTHHFSAI